MPIKNTKDSYGWASKLLHWSMAIIIFAMIAGGFYFDKVSYGPIQFQLLSLHKSFGLLILYLVGIRILWMAYTKKPVAIESHQKWEKYLSKAVHLFLYVAMIGMPVSGFIMSQSGGYPVKFFGLDMPRLLGKNEQLNELSYTIHEYLAYFLITAILLHAAGGLKHHVIDGDNTLKRMMTRSYVIFFAAIILILAGWGATLVWLLLF